MKPQDLEDVLSQTPRLSEEDIRQGKLVEVMRQSPGYPIVVEFWNTQREAIIQAGKRAAQKKDEFNAAGYWMMLDGFDKGVTMIEKVAKRAEDSDEIETLEREGRRRAQQ